MPSYVGATPTKAATAQYSYVFAGWSPVVSGVTGDVTYTAQFTETVNKYTVTWKNYNGTVLKTDTVDYGAVPHYSGATPTKPGNVQNSYMFDTWTPAVSEVTANVTYTAVFTTSTNKYTVTWNNYDGTLLEKDTDVEFGSTPSYNGPVPQKAGNDQYSYVFAGWLPELAEVSGNATYTATFDRIENKYKIVWKNYDGSVLETDDDVLYGAMPIYNGSTPKKAATAQYSYTFAGWSPTVSTVTGNATYTAQFTETVNKYTVTWENHNGTVLKTDTLNYGDMPSYVGAVPTRASTTQYSYTFAGWSPTVSTVAENMTYTAQFTETVNKYTVIWQNFDGAELKIDTIAYGAVPEYRGIAPQKAGDERYSYKFIGWTPTVAEVSSDVTYTAIFERSENIYEIVWKNYDGTALKTDILPYGTLPSYGNAAPERAKTAQYTYTFTGWTPNITSVTENATYTAQFSEKVNEYTVTWRDYDGTVLKTETLDYGTTPVYSDAAPTKAGNAQYTYTFTGWTPNITSVTENATYTAQFSEKVNEYTVTWKDGEEVLAADTLEYGATPVYHGNTDKPATKEKSFEFLGWSPTISLVSSDAVYTAVYRESTIYYGVVWMIGETVLPAQLYEYGQIPVEPSDPTQYLTTDERPFAKFAGWDKKVGPVTDNITYKANFYTEIPGLTEEEQQNVSLEISRNAYTLGIEKKELAVGLSRLASVAAANEKDLIIEYENGVQIYFPNKLASEIIEKKLHVLLVMDDVVQEVELLSALRSVNGASNENKLFGGRVVFTDDNGNIVPLSGWQLRVPVENGNMSGILGYSLDDGEKSYRLSQSGNYAVFVSDGSTEFKLVRKLSVRVEANEGGNVSFGEIKAGEPVKADIKVAIGYEVESVEVYYEKDGEKVIVNFDTETDTFVMPEYDAIFSVKFKKLAFVVNFYVDGELYSTEVYNYGDDLTLPAQPVKTDETGLVYDFSGWTPDVSAKVFESADYHAKFNASIVADDDYGKVDHGCNFPYMLFTIAVLFFGTVGGGACLIVHFVKKRKKSDLNKKN